MPAKKPAAPEPVEAAPPRSGKKKIVVLVLVLILLMAGGGASFWFFKLRAPTDMTGLGIENGMNGAGASTVAPDLGTPGSPATPADMPRPSSHITPLPEVTVNLSDASGDRYLKIAMEVELSTPEAVAEVERQNARIRDALIILLSSKTYNELASAEGKMQLKNDIAARINQILGVPRVVRIYYTQFVIS